MTVAADGSFLYYPNPGFTGTDSFKFAASAAEGGPTMISKETQQLAAQLLYPDWRMEAVEPHQLRFRSDLPNVIVVTGVEVMPTSAVE